MANINPSILQIGSTIFMLVMALTVIFIRMRASNRPVTIKKIIIPPFAMSTGFMMFVSPDVRIPILWAFIAFLIGWFVFSYPIIRSTKLEIIDDQVYTKKSKSFVYILLGLLVLRLLLHSYIEKYITVPQTAALFFLLAYGMITHWRFSMYRQYKKIILSEPSV